MPENYYLNFHCCENHCCENVKSHIPNAISVIANIAKMTHVYGLQSGRRELIGTFGVTRNKNLTDFWLIDNFNGQLMKAIKTISQSYVGTCVSVWGRCHVWYLFINTNTVCDTAFDIVT
jgi:hypothetical protein